MNKYVYLRLSKDDNVSILQQEDVINKKYGVNRQNATFYEETGSAYKIEQINKRKEFKRLIQELFSAESISISQLIYKQNKPNPCELYVFGYDRISRIMEDNILFTLLCGQFEVQIFSCKENPIIFHKDADPSQRFVNFIVAAAHGFQANSYSYQISENVKKSVDSVQGITVSKDGNKWGKKFTTTTGDKVHLDMDTLQKMNKTIRFHHKATYTFIQNIIKQKFNIVLGKSYIYEHKKN